MNDFEILKITTLILALMVAIIGHEIMHGYVALRYGDTTAKLAGRLTINPIKHVDPIGTIVVPAVLYFSGAPFLFGWAKPVPIDTQRVYEGGGYNGLIAVSLAGIAYNFTLALACAIMSQGMVLESGSGMVDVAIKLFLLQMVIYNVVLGFFNLWPIPPLDGSHALGYLSLKMGNRTIPEFFNKFERWGFVVLILILATPLSEIFFAPVRWALSFLI